MNNSLLVVLPILIPFITTISCILCWQWPQVKRGLTLLGTSALLITSSLLLWDVAHNGIISAQMGDWPAPFGITLVADVFSAAMVWITGLIGLCVALYSISSLDNKREHSGYYPLYNTLLMGVCGAFLTGDIFNLYVWFEVLLISSFVLLTLGGEQGQLVGAVQYVVLNLLASALFLAAAGMLYSVAGTLNMADLALVLGDSSQEADGLVTAVAMLLLVSFGIKAAIFPLFFWLPVSYPTPPIAITAIFGALLTKVGVYALIRVFTLIFVGDSALTHNLILVLAALTMISGVFGAASEYEVRRILSFHIISQIGYMIMGLAIFTPLALAGALYFIIHNIIAKTNLFLISGLVHRLRGSYQLRELGGLYRTYPFLGILFLISALSLAGVPPLSGFWGKLTLIRGGLEAEQYAITAAALFVSLWTLYSMMKIWAEGYLREPDPPLDKPPLPLTSYPLLLAPIVVLATLTILMGLFAEPILRLFLDAAEQMLDRQAYIDAVLNAAPITMGEG